MRVSLDIYVYFSLFKETREIGENFSERKEFFFLKKAVKELYLSGVVFV